MSTVAARKIASSPERDSVSTWDVIVDLLAPAQDHPARKELKSVSGVAASIIGDRSPEVAPITVTCDGPQTRIRCLYDEKAIDGSSKNEAKLGYDPLTGEWAISLPCSADDLDWVQRALSERTEKVTARDQDATDQKDQTAAATTNASGLTIDVKEFTAT
jgi:hypothetical protein